MRARILLAAKEWGCPPWQIPLQPGWLRWLRERELLADALAPNPPADDYEDDDE
jgi:hypothetical protein